MRHAPGIDNITETSSAIIYALGEPNRGPTCSKAMIILKPSKKTY